MIKVSNRDRLFVAIALPIALVTAYVYGWRQAAVRELTELEGERARTVAEQEFPRRKIEAIRQLQISRFELADEQAVKAPPKRVKFDLESRQAEREERVFHIFREAGVSIIGVEAAEAANTAIAAVLKDAGVVSEIACREFTLEGDYGAVVNALGVIAERELAVLPEALELCPGDRNRWRITIWL